MKRLRALVLRAAPRRCALVAAWPPSLVALHALPPTQAAPVNDNACKIGCGAQNGGQRVQSFKKPEVSQRKLLHCGLLFKTAFGSRASGSFCVPDEQTSFSQSMSDFMC